MSSIRKPGTQGRPGSGSSASSFNKDLPPTPPSSRSRSKSLDMSTILVGEKKQKFRVKRELICEIAFFRDRLEDPLHSKTICLWLPGESPAMFALFVEWIHSPSTFNNYLDQTITMSHENTTNKAAAHSLHWALVHLHLFAAELSLFDLQDAAMDAIQNLYFKYDYDISPKLLTYLYTECEMTPATSLRRWAVAMVSFALAGDCLLRFHPEEQATSSPELFRPLFGALPSFLNDYATHMENMTTAGYNVLLKNPQLRIASNDPAVDQQYHGFKQCSFHTHCNEVGESNCPYYSTPPAPEKTAEKAKSLKSRSSSKRLRDGVKRTLFSRHHSDSDKPTNFARSITTTLMGRAIWA